MDTDTNERRDDIWSGNGPPNWKVEIAAERMAEDKTGQVQEKTDNEVAASFAFNQYGYDEFQFFPFNSLTWKNIASYMDRKVELGQGQGSRVGFDFFP